jgi:nickel/cobalt exporter
MFSPQRHREHSEMNKRVIRTLLPDKQRVPPRSVAVLFVLSLCYMYLCGRYAQPVGAHPLGNFTVNRYSRIEVGPERVTVRYVLDMAEIPAFQEIRAQERDITVDGAAKDAYAAQQAAAIGAHIRLTLDGTPVALAPETVELTFPPGQADLATLRLSVRYSAPLAIGYPRTAEYRDANFADRQGWKEIVVRALPGVALAASDAPTEDTSDELRAYPQDMLQSPRDQDTAHFRFAPGDGGITVPADRVRATGRSGAAFTDLIAARERTLPVVVFSLVAAFAFGAAHALTPGHGKTLVGAYLVGSRGTPRHALALGATVTVTHTASVFALGFVTLFASRYILPERLYPILSILSGLLVAAMGGALCWHRFRAARAGWRVRGSRFAVEGGHSIPRTPNREPRTDYWHEHEDGTAHSHGPFGGHTHSHALPEKVTWRNLMALGVSGGLLPCPSALVVMLSAIALHRVGFGIVLILAFSLGLAAVLTGIGLLFVYAGRLMGRFAPRGRIAAILPIASALGVFLLGLAMTARAALQV